MAPVTALCNRLCLAIGASALVLGLAAPAATQAARTSHPSPSGTSVSSCSLPLIHDPYDGFHIGVPTGWDLSTLGDTIAVTRDPSASEMAVVFPALLANGLTPATLFSSYAAVQEKTAASDGNALSFHLISKPAQLPRALVSGRAGKVAISGLATISMRPTMTRIASSELVFSGYWAPTTRLSADTPMLASIAACYGPEAGTLYQVYNDQAFYFALPLGWQVADEGQDNIDLIGDSGRAIVSYLLTLMSTSQSGTTPRSLLEAIFAQIHLQITRILSSTDSLTQQGAAGSVLGEEYMEFLGQFQGKAIHGFVIIVNSSGPSVTSGVMRLALATTDEWNADNGGLLKVMTSVRHSLVPDEEQWQHLQQQWQQFDQTEQKFDDVLNGIDEVRDPSTGIIYAAPYDAYDASGPDGPGYYKDDGGILQRLQPVKN